MLTQIMYSRRPLPCSFLFLKPHSVLLLFAFRHPPLSISLWTCEWHFSSYWERLLLLMSVIFWTVVESQTFSSLAFRRPCVQRTSVGGQGRKSPALEMNHRILMHYIRKAYGLLIKKTSLDFSSLTTPVCSTAQLGISQVKLKTANYSTGPHSKVLSKFT